MAVWLDHLTLRGKSRRKPVFSLLRPDLTVADGAGFGSEQLRIRSGPLIRPSCCRLTARQQNYANDATR